MVVFFGLTVLVDTVLVTTDLLGLSLKFKKLKKSACHFPSRAPVRIHPMRAQPFICMNIYTRAKTEKETYFTLRKWRMLRFG
jgi:hypothetical protein